jgi:hypothetical protein
MPPQTNVYVTAPQAAPRAAKAKGFMGFLKSKSEAGQGWTTVRTLGQSTRRAPRSPVLE